VRQKRRIRVQLGDEIKQQRPVSPEAEAAVLGAMLMDVHEARSVQKIVTITDFDNEQNRAVFGAIVDVLEDGEPCDLVTVSQRMRQQGLSESIPSTYLADLVQKCISPSLAEHHGRIVASLALARELSTVAASIHALAGNVDPAMLMREAGRLMRDVEAKMAVVSSGKDCAIVTFQDVEEELGNVTWLWHKWIPAGLITLLAGDDGIGKSRFLIRLAQTIVQGYPWPDGQPFAIPNNLAPEVMFIDTEGSHAVNLNRLKTTRVPLDRVYWFKDPRSDDKMMDVKLDNKTTWETFERTVVLRRPAIVMFDALRGLFSGNENSSQDVIFLERIASLGRDTKTSMLISHHPRKRQADALKGVLEKDDIRGAGAIRQWARSIIAMDTPDPDDSRVRIRSLKSTLSTPPTDLGMRHDDSGVTFDFAPPRVPHKETLTDRAAEFLLNSLRGGSMPQKDVRESAEAAGFTWPTVMRAKDRIGIASVPLPRIPGVRGAQGWIWSLPVRSLPNGSNNGE